MRPVAEYNDRVQLVFRLSYDDHSKLSVKLKADDLSLQNVAEKLIQEYLRDNRTIMRILAPLEGEKVKRRTVLSASDREKLLAQNELESPLQDVVIQHDPLNKD